MNYYEENVKNMCLCEARHYIPEAIDGAIFPSVLDPTKINELDKIALEKLEGVTHLNLYVTGLSVALASVINCCIIKDISLDLYHYNRETNDYYHQHMHTLMV